MTMDFDMSKIAEEIVMQAKENQDEFIIETIFPFCEDVLQIKIDKEKLKQILLNDIQKPQSCEDCISREDAIKQCGFGMTSLLIADNLRRLPPVTPRPKGKWIQTKDDCDGVNFYDFSFECSKCGKEQSFKSNYCPNCGAYMRESEEEK